MTNELNPPALKALRKRNRWTQDRLAEKAGCSKEQVSRWERGKSLRLQTDSLNNLAKAFDVDPAALTGCASGVGGKACPAEPTRHASGVEDEAPSWFRPVQLNVRVTQSTRNALELVGSRYGVKWSDIVEMAPLLFFIVAEKCLARRQEVRMSIWEKLDGAREIAEAAAPHLVQATLPFYEEDLNQEGASIDKREVGYVVNNHGCHHPLKQYLEELVGELEDVRIDIKNPMDSDVPEYAFPDALVRQACGISDEHAELPTILSGIRSGRLDLRELRRMGHTLSEADFAKWLRQELALLQANDLDL